MSGLQQQHAKCAGSLKRQVAHAEPYVQVCIVAAAPSQHLMSSQLTGLLANQIVCQWLDYKGRCSVNSNTPSNRNSNSNSLQRPNTNGSGFFCPACLPANGCLHLQACLQHKQLYASEALWCCLVELPSHTAAAESRNIQFGHLHRKLEQYIHCVQALELIQPPHHAAQIDHNIALQRFNDSYQLHLQLKVMLLQLGTSNSLGTVSTTLQCRSALLQSLQ